MNKFILTALLMVVMAASGSNVIIYDPPTGKILAYLISANTPEYQGATNALINPVLPSVPLQFAKVSNSVVVAMSAAESNAVLAASVALADIGVRAGASNQVQSFRYDGLALRAFADASKDEINLLRLEMSIAKTNFVLFQTRATMAPRTLTQLKNSINGKIGDGSAD